jgi:replicative DNA helicase
MNVNSERHRAAESNFSHVAGGLPHSVEAEQGLLGAILINNEAHSLVSRLIETGDFYEPIHQRIYGVAGDLIGAGKLATPVTLKNHLPADLDIAGLSLNQYLARLCTEATTVINAPDYAKVIRDLAHRRSMMAIAEELQTIAAASPVDFSPDMLAQQMIERLDEIVVARTETHVPRVAIGDAAAQAVDQMSAVMARDGAIGGITTGLKTLDHLTDGLRRGELALMAGRPGMGKTGLMQSSALNTAAAGYNGLIFSLEMGAVSLGSRAISDVLHDPRDPVPYWRIARGDLAANQVQTVVDAARHLHTFSLVVDPQPSLTVSQIAARARKHARTLERQGKTLDVVYVDHIHIIKPNDRYRGNRTAEITEISGALKALAKELNVALVGLAQLSRAVESRDDKRPTMADLRDSGSLEQDADLIVFLYREEYYLQRQYSDPVSEDRRIARLAEVRNKLELFIAKQRNGPTGSLQIFFDCASNAARDLEERR